MICGYLSPVDDLSASVSLDLECNQSATEFESEKESDHDVTVSGYRQSMNILFFVPSFPFDS